MCTCNHTHYLFFLFFLLEKSMQWLYLIPLPLLPLSSLFPTPLLLAPPFPPFSSSRTFGPLWGVLKGMCEKLISIHTQFVKMLSELAKEITDYNHTQKEKFKSNVSHVITQYTHCGHHVICDLVVGSDFLVYWVTIITDFKVDIGGY